MQASTVLTKQILAAAIKGVLPVKYAYLGSGAEIHDSYARTESYATSNGRYDLDAAFLEIHMAYIYGALRHIIDIGPGNGRRSVGLMKCLISKVDVGFVRYDAVENSERLAEMAEAQVERVLGCDGVRFLKRDVEQPGVLTELSIELGWRNTSSFAMVLGNTLGNVEAACCVLNELRKSLSPGSFVFFTVAALPTVNSNNVKVPYENDLFKSGIISGLVYAGVPAGMLRVEVAYEELPFPGVFGRAVLLGDVKIVVGDESFILRRGHSIRCFQSRRFRAAEIDGLVGAANMRLIDKRMAKTKGIWRCLAIC
jgi:hypothetical protein